MSDWKCPECGLINNLSGSTKCFCGYDNTLKNNFNKATVQITVQSAETVGIKCTSCRFEGTVHKSSIPKSGGYCSCPKCGSMLITLDAPKSIVTDTIKIHDQNKDKISISNASTPNSDGNTVYYKAAIGNNFDKYSEVVKEFENNGGHPTSWHWPALFVGPAWALYRKMYGVFFIYLAVMFTLEVLAKLSPIFGFGLLLMTVLFAVSAKSIYVKHVSKKIDSCRDMSHENKISKLMNNGGTNAWVPYLAVIPMIGIIVAIVIPQFAKKKETIPTPVSNVQSSTAYQIPTLPVSENATLNLSMTNSCSGNSMLWYIFYDDFNKAIIPSSDQHWEIKPGQSQSHEIPCKKGEKICYGASLGSDNQYWGVGLNASYGCTDCCVTCDNVSMSWNLGTTQ